MGEENLLIQEAPVVRSEDGSFKHPDMPFFSKGEQQKYLEWVSTQGIEVGVMSIESSGDDVANRYFESGLEDFSYWEPLVPVGKGWFCLSIHNTENGPVCSWARRVIKP